jgi:hypothetical protein
MVEVAAAQARESLMADKPTYLDYVDDEQFRSLFENNVPPIRSSKLSAEIEKALLDRVAKIAADIKAKR